MYYDARTHQPYIHNHVIYRCECGKLVATCPCPSPDDKEVIVFDTCHHTDVHYVVSDDGEYREAMNQPVTAKSKSPKKKAKAAAK